MKPHPKIRLEGGVLKLNFGEYGHEVEVAAFSPDGRRLLTVVEVGTAQLWDPEDMRLLAELKPLSALQGSDKSPTTRPFETFIEGAALSSDGGLAVLGLNDGTAVLYDVTGEPRKIRTFMHPEKECEEAMGLLKALSFSPDDELVAIGFYQREVGVWRVGSGELVTLLKPERLAPVDWGRQELATQVFFAGSAIVATFGDNTAQAWELSSGETIFKSEPRSAVLACKQTTVGLLRAFADGDIYRDEELVLRTDLLWRSVAFSPDGNEFLSYGGRPHLVRRHTFDGETEVLGDTGFVAGSSVYDRMLLYPTIGAVLFPLTHTDISYVFEGRKVCLSNAEQVLRVKLGSQLLVLETTDGKGYHTKKLKCYRLGHTDPFGVFEVENLGSWCFSEPNLFYGEPGATVMIDLISGARFSTEGRQWSQLEVVGDFLWAQEKNLRRCWKIEKDRIDVVWSEVPEDFRDPLLPAPGGRVLILSRDTHPSRLLQAEGTQIATHPAKIDTLDFYHLDGETLYISPYCGELQVWNLEGELLRTLPNPNPSPTNSDFWPVWELPQGLFPIKNEGPRGWGTTAYVSPGGSRMLTPTRNGAALVDLRSERVLSEVEFDGRLRAGCFPTETNALGCTAEGIVFSLG